MTPTVADLRGPARVLVVCRANVCRSPTATLLLRRWLPNDSTIDMASAGWDAAAEGRWCPSARALVHEDDDARELAETHRARLLDHEMVLAADLVLAADRRSRAEVARRAAGHTAHLFTLTEAALLAAAVAERRGADVHDLAQLVEEMDAARGTVSLPQARVSRWPGRSRPGIDIPDAHSSSPKIGHRWLNNHTYAVTAMLGRSIAPAGRSGVPD
ncbi:MAG: hypothetical protein H0X12_03255 [Nocardioides sp.]|nr:hypothetical protein [Nocardioides sp.]